MRFRAQNQEDFENKLYSVLNTENHNLRVMEVIELMENSGRIIQDNSFDEEQISVDTAIEN